jgi:hypothetical protein
MIKSVEYDVKNKNTRITERNDYKTQKREADRDKKN